MVENVGFLGPAGQMTLSYHSNSFAPLLWKDVGLI